MFDVYNAVCVPDVESVQLVAITCILIATKLHEEDHVDVRCKCGKVDPLFDQFVKSRATQQAGHLNGEIEHAQKGVKLIVKRS